MIKPVIFTVVDEESIGDGLAHDLEHRFGADYWVIAVRSANSALERLDAMRQTGDEVAMVIAGPQLLEMSGIALLDRAADLHQGSQRGLLVSPGPAGMTGPVRRAMLLGHLDFQIPTPWVSAEESVYPPVTDALSIWTRLHRPHDESITIVGRQWAPRSHELRDLLDRSGVPYGFYAVDSARGQELIVKHDISLAHLPIAIDRNGNVLRDPSNEAVAAALGVATQPPTERADVAIIGAGPAGLAAAVHGASEGLRTVVVESGALGGQAAASHQILNYPGFPHGLSGHELTTRTYFQALLFGALFVFVRRVVGLEPRGEAHVLTFDNGTQLETRAVIVASGVAPRRLGIPSLEALVGRGVFYGSTGAEAAALVGEEVCVVGGGNAAGQAALHLAEHAARVTLLVRGDSLAPSMSDYLIQRLGAADNIDVRLQTEVVDCIGERRLRGLVLEERATGRREDVAAAALFAEIGGEPHTHWLPESVARDEHGYILTERDVSTDPGRLMWPLERPPFSLETSVPGVFAAGDVRHGTAKRVAPAIGEGAVAIRSVHEYLGNGNRPGGSTPALVTAMHVSR
jgi:thioredoxin reductase (NADPH)